LKKQTLAVDQRQQAFDMGNEVLGGVAGLVGGGAGGKPPGGLPQ
jgi:hypothetical protein